MIFSVIKSEKNYIHVIDYGCLLFTPLPNEKTPPAFRCYAGARF